MSFRRENRLAARLISDRAKGEGHRTRECLRYVIATPLREGFELWEDSLRFDRPCVKGERFLGVKAEETITPLGALPITVEETRTDGEWVSSEPVHWRTKGRSLNEKFREHRRWRAHR